MDVSDTLHLPRLLTRPSSKALPLL